MDFAEFLDHVRYLVGDGAMPISELWENMKKGCPNMTVEIFKSFLIELNIGSEYRVDTTTVFKKKTEKIQQNQNKSKAEDLMKKYQRPVTMPADQKS